MSLCFRWHWCDASLFVVLLVSQLSVSRGGSTTAMFLMVAMSQLCVFGGVMVGVSGAVMA